MLGASDAESREMVKRVKVMSAARRPVAPKHFEVIGGALTRRLRVQLHYWVRSRREMTERTVSPQRLVHWRNTWYLDAWCHATIREADLVDQRAKDVSIKTIEAELDAGYGAFSGGKVQWATLEFTPEAAQWVRHEQWHPQQEAKLHADGSLTLRVPYTDATELSMDILRHGEQVRVAAPAALAAAVKRSLEQAAARYA
jgi:predicted DNA-binding transcriptional regulator YafY